MPALFVSLVWAVPSGFIEDDLEVAVAKRVKTIFWASGEKDGQPSKAPLVVSLAWEEPSAFMA